MRTLWAFYSCIFKSLEKHKIDTLLSFLDICANQAISIVFLYIIFGNVPSLQGYSRDELLMIYGIFVYNKGIAAFFTESLYEIESQVKAGTFDGILVRPVRPIIQILGLNLGFGELVNVGIGLAMIIAKLPVVKAKITILDIIIILLFVVLSVMVVFSIRLICMSVSFWTLTSFPVAIAVDNVSDFAKYPTSIYNKGVKFILDYIIPFAVLAYFPTLVLLKGDVKVLFVSVAITVVLFLLSMIVWRIGIKNYKSSGH